MSIHSEFAKLEQVFIKSVAAAFESQDQLDQQWEALNYLERPDYDKAQKEYETFEALLKKGGAEIKYFSPNDAVSIDSIYCRDASIVTDHGVILCQMGKGQRVPEPEACEKDYAAQGVPILGRIEAPGCIEGGDVAWLDTKTLAVAHGYRSNDAGFAQLKALLNPFGIEVMQVDLPHYKGASDVFHLMSIFSPVDADKAVVYSPLMPVRFREELLRRKYQLIEVPEEEFESMGCNVLAIAPSLCMMVKGNPITKSKLEAAGCEVWEYEGQEISVKGGGGPTCLTRPSKRS